MMAVVIVFTVILVVMLLLVVVVDVVTEGGFCQRERTVRPGASDAVAARNFRLDDVVEQQTVAVIDSVSNIVVIYVTAGTTPIAAQSPLQLSLCPENRL